MQWLQQLKHKNDGLLSSIGRLKNSEAARAAAAESVPSAPSERQLQLSLQRAHAQRAAALSESEEYRKKVAELQEQLSQRGGRGQRQPEDGGDGGSWVRFFPLIKKGEKGADGFTVECCRRLVEEAKLSFEQAATANAIVLGMHMRAVPEQEQLLSGSFFRRCVERAGVLDEESRSELFRSWSEMKAWAIAADAGSK